MKYKEINSVIKEINVVMGKQETKVQKKLFKFAEKLKPYQETFAKEWEELRLDNAATDDKGVLILNKEGDFTFTKDGLKKLQEDLKKLNDKEFEFTKILVVNPQGLEEFHFLEDWTTGIEFKPKEEEIEEEL